jgi:hypothetical protein
MARGSFSHQRDVNLLRFRDAVFFYFFSVCVLSNGTAYLARNFSFLNLCTN